MAELRADNIPPKAITLQVQQGPMVYRSRYELAYMPAGCGLESFTLNAECNGDSGSIAWGTTYQHQQVSG